MGWAPLVWIGGLSYSLYLWHWPVIILSEWAAIRAGTQLPLWGKVVVALASVLPAWLSWRYVESPIHHGKWLSNRPKALLSAGLALSAVAALSALPLLPLRSPFQPPPVGAVAAGAAAIGDTNRPWAIDNPSWVTPDPLTAGHDRPAADVDHCQVPATQDEAVRCDFGVAAGSRTIALVGDSKAMQWLPALESLAARHGWRIETYGKSSCTFAASPAVLGAEPYPSCDAWNAAVLTQLKERRPNLIVTSGAAAQAGSRRGPSEDALVEGYAARWRALGADGIPVLVIADNPRSPNNLDICASLRPHDLGRCSFPLTAAQQGSGIAAQRQAAERAGNTVSLADFTSWLCPGQECPVVIGNVTVHRAGDHLIASYVRSLAFALEPDLLARFGQEQQNR